MTYFDNVTFYNFYNILDNYCKMAKDVGKLTEFYKKPQDDVAWCITRKNGTGTIYCTRQKACKACVSGHCPNVRPDQATKFACSRTFDFCF